MSGIEVGEMGGTQVATAVCMTDDGTVTSCHGDANTTYTSFSGASGVRWENGFVLVLLRAICRVVACSMCWKLKTR